jgi:8-oxo-dGTP pyrophosphatase MutT (NUDIX family)
MPREFSAGAIIFRIEDGKIKYLMLKKRYRNVYWDLPKGNIEKGESEEETVRREVKEETGIDDIQFIPGFKEKVHYFYKKGKETVYKEVTFFLAKTNKKRVKLSYEHDDYGWFTIEEIKKLRGVKWKVIEKADRFLKGRLSYFISSS